MLAGPVGWHCFGCERMQLKVIDKRRCERRDSTWNRWPLDVLYGCGPNDQYWIEQGIQWYKCRCFK
jgi:hypothetical protein